MNLREEDGCAQTINSPMMGYVFLPQFGKRYCNILETSIT
ncbi:hypothetical protein SAMN03080602_03732 [Arenibacter troitsensis]|uniref:Uncharacterized protein n=1 Tax=Arenibacter troitsensis TaxID=188872 RepID=A0A1X7L3U4_9FLAO|nr:hypothetical protein SAMN03080602_03732 [Arenibacter troitsensis]